MAEVEAETTAGVSLAQDKCIMQYVTSVEMIAKFHSGQVEINQYTVVVVLKKEKEQAQEGQLEEEGVHQVL